MRKARPRALLTPILPRGLCIVSIYRPLGPLGGDREAIVASFVPYCAKKYFCIVTKFVDALRACLAHAYPNTVHVSFFASHQSRGATKKG